MPVVAKFSTHFLEYSQTFVYDEISLQKRYDVEVFCRRRMNADRFPYERVHVAGPLYGLTRKDVGFERHFATGRFAVVHAHFGLGGVYALRYAKKYDLPLVVTFHGYDVPILQSPARFGPKYLRYTYFARSLLERMTIGLCASVELKDILRELGVPDARLALHHIGIDVERFAGEPRQSSGPAEVVMLGRFVDKKGFEYGIQAFARATAGTDARLTLIGGGELEGKYRALAKSLGIASRVVFAGMLESRLVAERLRESDVLLAPSVVAGGGNRESGLLSVKEASASCVVPIGTLHGGIPEIIDDGVTGFLVPERDVTALADRLRLLLSDPELRRKMAIRARHKMQAEYDNRVSVERLETRYDDAVLRHERSRISARPAARGSAP
jgi:glycosyltransferase involved in cell wall biosynthesis